MAEWTSHYPSLCGKYVASRRVEGIEIDVFEVEGDTTELYATYDIRKFIRAHILREHIYSGEYEGIGRGIEVKLVWEEILPGTRSTKFAVVLKKLNMIVVIDIRDRMEPAVIEQKKADGIESIVWIPPVIGDIGQHDGAYVNSIQLLIFTKFKLQAKLFSLDCTQILWTLDKPSYDSILLRPNLNNRFWSISLSASFAPNQEMLTILHHMYNSGSESFPIAALRLGGNSDVEKEMKWSKSGKWICNLNDNKYLFGFTLQIYNLLGVFFKSLEQEEMPRAQPITEINYLTDGIIERLQKDSTIDFGCTNYEWDWLFNEGKEGVLVAGLNHGTGFLSLELLFVSIKLLGIIDRTTINISETAYSWDLTISSTAKRYKKVESGRIFPKDECRIKDLKIFNCFSSSIIFIQIEDIIFILRIEYSNVETVSYKLITPIRISSKLISKFFVGEKYEDSLLILVLDDHILTYSFDKEILKILKSYGEKTIYGASLDKEVGKVHITLFRRHSEPVWDRVELSYNPKSSSAFHENTKDEVKVDKLITKILDVKSFSGAGLDKAVRTNGQRLSFAGNSSMVDEATDTFSVRKRKKI